MMRKAPFCSASGERRTGSGERRAGNGERRTGSGERDDGEREERGSKGGSEEGSEETWNMEVKRMGDSKRRKKRDEGVAVGEKREASELMADGEGGIYSFGGAVPSLGSGTVPPPRSEGVRATSADYPLTPVESPEEAQRSEIEELIAFFEKELGEESEGDEG